MKLDILISKYLDGDLTRREDEELRLLLTGDPAAKTEFDAAVALHLTMQTDSDLEDLPEEDFLQIESNILAAVQPVFAHPIASSAPKVFYLNMRRFASAAAAVLLISSIPVADTLFSGGRGGSVAAIAPASVQSDIVKSTIRRFGNTPNTAASRELGTESNIAGEFTPATEAIIPGEAAFTLDFDGNEGITKGGQNVAADMRSIIPAEPVAPQNSDALYRDVPAITLHAGNRSGSAVPSFTTIASMNNVLREPEINAESGFVNFAESKPLEVQMTTFIANGVLKVGGNAATAATSVSQSIAYAVNGDNRVGIEVGYTGYSVTDVNTVAVATAAGKGGKGGTVMSMGDNPSSPAQNDSRSETELKTVSMTTDKTVVWGSAFYERTLIDKGDLTVNARLGAGGSPEGPMAFGRAFARYTVFTGVSLTLGAESRVLALQAPLSESLSNKTGTGVSVVYGVQVKF